MAPCLAGLAWAPYWIYRHELYFAALFPLIVIFVFCALRKRFLAAGAALFLMCLMRQTMLPLVPLFLMLHFFCAADRRRAGLQGALFLAALGAAALLSARLFPGILQATVLFHWQDSVPTALSFMGCGGALLPGGRYVSSALQILLSIILLFWSGRRLRLRPTGAEWLGATALVSLTFNFFAAKASNYFYLETFFFFAIYLLVKGNLEVARGADSADPLDGFNPEFRQAVARQFRGRARGA